MQLKERKESKEVKEEEDIRRTRVGDQQGFPSQFAYVSNNIVSNSFRVLMNNIIK